MCEWQFALSVFFFSEYFQTGVLYKNIVTRGTFLVEDKVILIYPAWLSCGKSNVQPTLWLYIPQEVLELGSGHHQVNVTTSIQDDMTSRANISRFSHSCLILIGTLVLQATVGLKLYKNPCPLSSSYNNKWSNSAPRQTSICWGLLILYHWICWIFIIDQGQFVFILLNKLSFAWIITSFAEYRGIMMKCLLECKTLFWWMS